MIAERVGARENWGMTGRPIAAIETHHVALPTRREHKWTGLTEPIGGYVLTRMTDDAGVV